MARLGAEAFERLAARIDQADGAEGRVGAAGQHLAQCLDRVDEVLVVGLQQQRGGSRVLRHRRHVLQIQVVEVADGLDRRIRDQSSRVAPRLADRVLLQRQVERLQLVLDLADRFGQLDRARST